ncbi:putative disease resistance protein RGA3 [Corylus avellana]|uniref:putative disease resistance protein RGA3 n=1 Tax=Corylus avellana TaxID=13451 RepID=UPI00286B1226|nr:putative disease resistance protein RGA3 [Corylus avellana]XP_059451687.1 putative disease resistance protein RGA3 [Corylus avellana]
MAEPLLSFVAEQIIKTFGSLAVKQIGLLGGVKDELQSLTDTVSTIKDVLLDAEDKQAAGDRAVKRWLGRLEDVIYDADDLLDAVSTEALRREIMTRDKKSKKVRIFFSKSNQLAFRFRMAREIKAIRKKLDAINADRQNFHLEVRQVEPRVGRRERDNTHSFVPAEVVIGREDDKKAVIHLLLDSNVEENVSILPIVGIGGLGKTTLAQFVFNDHQIQKHFELRMWACVSDIFDVKNIVAKVLESATNEKPADAEMDTLVAKLREKIQGKKYFLVLDDVWNGEHRKWCRLKEVLMVGARGSRIVVTTRNEIVAKIIRQESVASIIGTVESYSLKSLDEDASWSLFKQKAFERGQEPENSSIVALGKEIIKKCSGVPLAISTIGSLLGSKNSEAEWLSFKNNELLKISQNETDLLPTLKLSYDHLPSHLKHCFAYCSLFPKHYKFSSPELIRLWIAQGFVKSSDDQSRCLEEVGREYFIDLLQRSFFQEAETFLFGDYRYKMHDLMHDLAISVAGSLMATLGDKETNIDEKNRHLSLRGYNKHFSSLCEASRIRSFLCLDNDVYKYKIDCDAIFSSFKFLRMLDLSSGDLDYVPSSIGELKHLRCLDLSGNKNIKKSPDSITRLHNLQTLRLFYCESLKELPRDIKKLVNLRHLDIDSCDGLTYMPQGLGQLNNLERLTDFVVHLGSNFKHCSGLRELNGLNKLRGSLKISNLGRGKDVALEYKAANLKEIQYLHSLSLCWSTKGYVNDWDVVDDEMQLEGFQPPPNLKHLHLYDYPGSRLPSWVFSLRNLVSLWLVDCHSLKSLPLQHLTSVQDLILERCLDLELANDEDGMQWHGLTSLLSLSFSGLPKLVSLPSGLQHTTTLQKLSLTKCESLKAIPDWIHNFKSLQYLDIYECSSLTSLPEGMGRLTSLKSLTIWDCPILLRRCENDTGEDWAKIVHIPELYLVLAPMHL